MSQFVVKVANLLEAEGRIARHHVTRILQAAVVLIAAATLLVVGLVALAAAGFLGLRLLMPAWAALAIIALIPLALGVVGALIGKDIIER